MTDKQIAWVAVVAIVVVVSLLFIPQRHVEDCTAPQSCLVGKALFLGALRGGLD